jgi:hypothetical protein
MVLNGRTNSLKANFLIYNVQYLEEEERIYNCIGLAQMAKSPSQSSFKHADFSRRTISGYSGDVDPPSPVILTPLQG